MVPMFHAEIDDGQFPERFVLDRLSVREREAFEEHLVDCRECQETVRAAGALAGGLSAVRGEFPAPARSASFWSRRIALWQAAGLAAAGFLLAASPSVLLYRQSLKPHPVVAKPSPVRNPKPEVFPVYPLELSRGAGTAEEPATRIAVSPGTSAVVLVMPRDVARQASSAELIDGAGRMLWVLAPLPEGDSDSLGLTAPADLLAPGRYALVLRSGGGVVARFPFAVTAGNSGGR
jgi:hypothetical protein